MTYLDNSSAPSTATCFPVFHLINAAVISLDAVGGVQARGEEADGVLVATGNCVRGIYARSVTVALYFIYTLLSRDRGQWSCISKMPRYSALAQTLALPTGWRLREIDSGRRMHRCVHIGKERMHDMVCLTCAPQYAYMPARPIAPQKVYSGNTAQCFKAHDKKHVTSNVRSTLL